MHISNKVALDVSQIDSYCIVQAKVVTEKRTDEISLIISVAGGICKIDPWRYYSY